tara:strand:- start:1082 stop:1765 length:684 start_codon:yes stop_codon:yes gene_type:complete
MSLLTPSCADFAAPVRKPVFLQNRVTASTTRSPPPSENAPVLPLKKEKRNDWPDKILPGCAPTKGRNPHAHPNLATLHMTTLKDRITADMKDAMRAKEAVRLESIRLLRAAIQRREVDERTELDEEEVLAVVQKMIKQGRDSIDQFEKGNRDDLVQKEVATLAVLETYLPEQLDDDKLAALIDQALTETEAQSIRDMGKVMGWLKPHVQGRVDMGAVSASIKQKLSP